MSPTRPSSPLDKAFDLGVSHALNGVSHPGRGAYTATAARNAMRVLAGQIADLSADAPDDLTDAIAEAYENGRISTIIYPRLDANGNLEWKD